jgi:hypothetical protein
VATCEQHIAAETEVKPCAGADDGGIVAYAEQQVGVGWLGEGEMAADKVKFAKGVGGHFQAAFFGMGGVVSGCLLGGAACAMVRMERLALYGAPNAKAA